MAALRRACQRRRWRAWAVREESQETEEYVAGSMERIMAGRAANLERVAQCSLNRFVPTSPLAVQCRRLVAPAGAEGRLQGAERRSHLEVQSHLWEQSPVEGPGSPSCSRMSKSGRMSRCGRMSSSNNVRIPFRMAVAHRVE